MYLVLLIINFLGILFQADLSQYQIIPFASKERVILFRSLVHKLYRIVQNVSRPLFQIQDSLFGLLFTEI